jgi:hypothetical protein
LLILLSFSSFSLLRQLTVADESESQKPKMIILGKIMSGLMQQNRETLNGQEMVDINQRQSTFNIQMLFRDLSSGQCPPGEREMIRFMSPLF